VLVIDVSNPIARRDGAAIVEWVDEQGGAGLATAKLLPGAHIVRAFNAINYAKLSADAHRQGELVGVPIAGDDPHGIGGPALRRTSPKLPLLKLQKSLI
jgi:hypothetical protein